jgi:hypothetical protein
MRPLVEWVLWSALVLAACTTDMASLTGPAEPEARKHPIRRPTIQAGYVCNVAPDGVVSCVYTADVGNTPSCQSTNAYPCWTEKPQ